MARAISEAEGTEAGRQHVCRPVQESEGCSSAPQGLTSLKLRASVASLPHALSLGKPESPMRHPTAAHLEICSWAPFFFTIPSWEGVGVGGAGGDGRGAGEPQGCEGPACALPAPVVTPGAGRHLGSGTGLTPIILILWGNTPWVQRWLQQSSACFSVSRKPLTVL